MKNKKIMVILVIIAIIFAILTPLYLFFKQGGTQRTPQSLLNQYYQLRDNDPQNAKQALDLILVQQPKNEAALRELGDFYLRQGDTYHALPLYAKLDALFPQDPEINLRYARLLLLTDNKLAAKPLLDQAYAKGNSMVHAMAAIELNAHYPVVAKIEPTPSASILPPQPPLQGPVTHAPATISTMSPSTITPVINAPGIVQTQPVPAVALPTSQATQWMDQYYALKKIDKAASLSLLKKITQQYPDYVLALKEMGYRLLEIKDLAGALPNFTKIYELTVDPQIALQVAYIFNGLGNNLQAYYYFDLATRTTDNDLRLKAEIAKTNLRDAPTKILPSPFFAEFYYDPFYYSRFNLMVYPVISRVGITANEKHQLEFYLIYRRTSDNTSTFTNNVPQIFEDDAAITSVGIRFNPIYQFPMAFFIEYGKAVDLIYQNRGRWRTDFRTGLALYQGWGADRSYTLHPEFKLNQVGDIYADGVYYSRYNDFIATARLREGARIFEYKTVMVDVYMRGFMVLDHNHEFYNNIFEIGPGIALTPFNRYNFVLRAEMVQGYYIPVNSPSPNPYTSPYHNNILQADFFIRL